MVEIIILQRLKLNVIVKVCSKMDATGRLISLVGLDDLFYFILFLRFFSPFKKYLYEEIIADNISIPATKWVTNVS